MNKHIRSNRLLVLTILAALLILFTGTLEAFATTSPTHATVKDELDGETYHSKTPLDNDALFEGYIEDRLSLPAQLSAAKQRGTKLTGLDLKIYNSLKPQIRKVADGEVQSSVMTVTLDDLGLADTVWTAEDLGVSAIVKNNAISNEAVDALSEQLNINIRAIVTALLADCPYELYWYDKVTGVTSRGPQYTATHNGTEYQLKLSSGITYSFSVAQGYSDGEYKVNTTNAERVQTAVTNAKAIVQSVKFISDYSKLYNYKQEICRLVSYDSEAANNKNTPYGDSWQLISVFDGDDSTNVVCEGYSKAFQYLCELTTFSNDISCISVTGTMAGGTGAGSHMWNIVNMEDGENYLTDITNCDAGTVGADDQLFLAGYISGSVESGYTYRCNGNHDILYVFDTEVVSNYGDELVMSDHKYVNQDTDELAIDQTTFPDEALRNYVSDHFDVDQNTRLSSTELAAVREIDCSGGYNGAKVKDLSGIEVFSGLTKLCVSNNDLHSIIIPSTSRMKSFVCGGNTNLESIELGLQPELCVIDVSGCTSLTSLDLTKCASGLNAGAGIDLKVSDCTGLQQLKMPASLVYFGAGEGKRDRIVTTNCSALQRLEFTGDAPEFAENAFQAFDGLYVDYPLENTTWTNTIKKSYGGKNIEWKCEHQLTAVAAAAATCTEDGNTAYWSCSNCHKFFSDENAENEIEENSWIVKSQGHVYDREVAEAKYLKSIATCVSPAIYYKSCKCGEKGTATFEHGSPDLDAHDWNNDWHTVEGSESTCIQQGQEYDTCKRDPEHIRYRNQGLSNHQLEKTAAKPATCTENGNIDYWTCKNCHKIFSDENATNEINEAATIVNKTGHTYGELIPAAPATCADAGMGAHYQCSVCKEYFDVDKNATTKDALIIPKTAHNMTEHPAVGMTCYEDGSTAYWSCSNCHKFFSDENGENEIEENSWIVKSQGHVYDREVAEEKYLKSVANCVSPAIYYKSCKCGEKGTATFEYGASDLNAHEWNDNWRTVEGDDSTCIHEGQEFDTCKRNPEHIRYRNKALSGHDLTEHAAKDATCTEDGNIAFWTCNVCQSVFTDKDGKTQVNASDVMVKAKGHNFSDWYTLEKSTYDKEGIEERECQTCHEKEQRKLAKLPKVSLAKAAVSGLKAKVYTGNGQTQTPVVTLNGRSLKAGTDYILTYKNNVAVGTATVMINGKGKYGGTVSKSFVINPKPATIVKPVAAKKAITVKWQKMAMLMPKARITGYQIQCSTDRNFKKNVKTNTVIGYAKTSKKVGGLKPKKSYHVRVRTYMTTGGKTYFSAWSSVKSAKAK